MINKDDGLIKNMEKSAEELGIASCIKFARPVNQRTIPSGFQRQTCWCCLFSQKEEKF
ncbi:hypothetical protein [Methanosarcina acetivorans]|uniref:hypothetical protein n=1 Tax=Methanosarcina acetivorans TaxID=2214 RepID=UPI000B110435|nr:hypothetical protein [Methanosarcina acetivorans]